MKIITVLGARPQFIKAAAFSTALSEFNSRASAGRGADRLPDKSLYLEESEEGGGTLLSESSLNQKSAPSDKGSVEIEEKILHTGQHYDFELSEQIFTQLAIPKPYVNLGIGSKYHGQMTGEMIIEIEKEIKHENPDWVLVYGDTNSTLAGALAAAKLHVPVCHVEAGLRSFDKRMPEEINRILTDHVSTLLFIPTRNAMNNLHRENISEGVHHVGDIMYDAAIRFGKIARQTSKILQQLSIKSFFLATVHRQENTEKKESLEGIVSAFDEIATVDCPVIFPVHPRTTKMLNKYDIHPRNPDVRILPPVPFLDMIMLEMNARAILTDSGGIQKEAYFHRTPCITLRHVTEWVETVEAGWNQVVGDETEKIVRAVGLIRQGSIIKDYGKGDAGKRMIQLILQNS
jgi:UDP-GlcNAc3NAcA epimerase